MTLGEGVVIAENGNHGVVREGVLHLAEDITDQLNVQLGRLGALLPMGSLVSRHEDHIGVPLGMGLEIGLEPPQRIMDEFWGVVAVMIAVPPRTSRFVCWNGVSATAGELLAEGRRALQVVRLDVHIRELENHNVS